MNWSALPFVRLIPPLAIGIGLGSLPSDLPWQGLIIAFGSLLVILLFLARQKLTFRYRRWYGGVLFISLLAFGFLLAQYHTTWQHPRHLRHFIDSAQYWQGTVRAVRPGEKSTRLQLELTAFSDSSRLSHAVHGKILLYLPSDSLSTNLSPGTAILFRAGLEPIAPPMNPHAFDFAAYMQKQGIYHRAFAKATAWTSLPYPEDSRSRQLFQIRQEGLRVLGDHLKEEATLAIGAALVMGQRDLLSEEVREAYTNTGAIHVLAVSGLHVGIIYLSLGWLLGLIGLKGNKWRWYRSVILIVAIWGFALFTGGSASVLRAASMFSFLIIGNALYRHHNIYNTLAASAFLLLCINPYLLFDVGFQLSYLAVVGIVFFQGRIYRAWYIPNRVGNYLWQLTSVSIAAQLTTLPVSLFYFHQFPLYFWLSGWVVVPAALIILCLGLSLLLLHQLPWIPDLLGHTLETVILTMNHCVFYIQQLPLAILNGIWLGTGTLLLLYLVLLSLMKGLHDRRLRPVQWALFGMIIIGGWYNYSVWKAAHQQGMTVYHLYGHTAVDVFDGRYLYTLSDLPAESPQLSMAAATHRAYRRIVQQVNFPLKDTSHQQGNFVLRDRFFQIGNTTAYLLDTVPRRAPPPAPLNVDCLILRNNVDISITQLLDYFSPGLIVFDASSYHSRCKNWALDCRERGIPCHDIGQQGAWTRMEFSSL